MQSPLLYSEIKLPRRIRVHTGKFIYEKCGLSLGDETLYLDGDLFNLAN